MTEEEKQKIREKFNQLCEKYWNCLCQIGCSECIPVRVVMNDMKYDYPWLREELKDTLS